MWDDNSSEMVGSSRGGKPARPTVSKRVFRKGLSWGPLSPALKEVCQGRMFQAERIARVKSPS